LFSSRCIEHRRPAHVYSTSMPCLHPSSLGPTRSCAGSCGKDARWPMQCRCCAVSSAVLSVAHSRPRCCHPCTWFLSLPCRVLDVLWARRHRSGHVVQVAHATVSYSLLFLLLEEARPCSLCSPITTHLTVFPASCLAREQLHGPAPPPHLRGRERSTHRGRASVADLYGQAREPLDPRRFGSSTAQLLQRQCSLLFHGRLAVARPQRAWAPCPAANRARARPRPSGPRRACGFQASSPSCAC
jgi:hypothetical protein